MVAQSRYMSLVCLMAVAVVWFSDVRTVNAQGAAAEAPAASSQDDVEKRLQAFMALGAGPYPLKEKDGRVTHLLLVGESPLRKSLGVSAETTATERAKAFATAELAKYIGQNVSFYQDPGTETLTLYEGDASGPQAENSKQVEKTTTLVKQQAEAMVRGLQTFSKKVTDEKVVVGLLWTEKAAAQSRGVADANNPPTPPKPRPAPGTVTPGTVVNPDAEQLLK